MREYNGAMIDDSMLVNLGKLLLDVFERVIRLRREVTKVDHALEVNKALYAGMGLAASFLIALVLASYALRESS